VIGMRWLEILARRRATASPGGWRQHLADRVDGRTVAAAQGEGHHGMAASGPFALPPGARADLDIAYGTDPAQRFDLYLPQHADGAPIFFMIHGGGWSRGDKALWRGVRNKVTCWVGRGYVFASVNYRMLPQADPVEQAHDVARALAHLQSRAVAMGGDPSRTLLVGHSSGAHLAALIAADPRIATQAGATPCAATIAIDSAAFDVEAIMRQRHFALYDRAFGADPAAWQEASPLHRLEAGLGSPMLAVCSSRRGDSCPQASAFAAKAASLGGQRVTVLPIDLSHGELNDLLGVAGDYTDAVLAFVRSIGLP
jgi:arylformamidase